MIRAGMKHCFVTCALLIMATLPAHAGQVVADLSQSKVSITSGFHGTELLLFGAIDGQKDDDIIVVITGPPTDIAQHRKDNVGGIWINVETNIWTEAPGLYQILATQPLAKIADNQTLEQLKIGASKLQLQPLAARSNVKLEATRVSALLETLVRSMEATGLWSSDVGLVELTDGALFRANVVLPANVISGEYDVKIFQFRDGIALSQSETKIGVTKGGLSATIYHFAHHHSLFYGLFAIAFAVAAGWLAAFAFRRS